MKIKSIFVLLMLGVIFAMTACQKSDEVEADEKQNFIPTCEIIESSDATCDKPVKTGIYTDYANWKREIDGTDVDVILELEDVYDEDFFEEKALVYLVDCSSGGGQFKYEGYEIEDNILYIKVSGSTEFLLNKLHAYHVFFAIDKEEAEKLKKAELSIFSRE